MTSGLFGRLVLPLLALVGLSAVLHWTIDTDGLWLNLLTELVGILVTVLYVDWVLRKHERDRWHETRARVSGRLHFLTAALITNIRGALGYGPDIYDEQVMLTGDPKRMREEITRVCEHVLEPTVRRRLDDLSPKQWHKLTRATVGGWDELGKAFSMFENRLSPEQQNVMLDLQDALRRSLTFYETFPDMAGIPDNELPQMKTPPELLKRDGYESTAKELRHALQLLRRLQGSLPDDESAERVPK